MIERRQDLCRSIRSTASCQALSFFAIWFNTAVGWRLSLKLILLFIRTGCWKFTEKQVYYRTKLRCRKIKLYNITSRYGASTVRPVTFEKPSSKPNQNPSFSHLVPKVIMYGVRIHALNWISYHNIVWTSKSTTNSVGERKQPYRIIDVGSEKRLLRTREVVVPNWAA